MKQSGFKLWKIAALAAAVASQYSNAAQQTWVSGLGNNNNPCTIAQPCASIQTALAATSPGGEVSILDGGPYAGTVDITQSVTINAVGAIVTIQKEGAGAAITINAPSTDVVTLRGLSINGGRTQGTNGIVFNAGARLQVENSTIFGFTGDGLLFQPSAASTLFVSNLSFRNNGGGGVSVTPTATGSANAAFTGVRVEGNLRGIKVDDASVALVRNSVVTGNSPGNGIGIFSLASGGRASTMTVENSTSTMNGNYGLVSNGPLASLRISGVTSTDNGNYGLAIGGSGGTVFTFGGNRFHGNYTAFGGGVEVMPGLSPTTINQQ